MRKQSKHKFVYLYKLSDKLNLFIPCITFVYMCVQLCAHTKITTLND